MDNFDHIQFKLQQFIKKYYVNELIKGLILFFSFGLLYFIVTLLIEYFLWLKPLGRTILFWIFVLVEVLLLTKFIAFPFFKLLGIQKGISFEEASRLIGKHFSEIDDKLLNVLQLRNSSETSELLLASIEQKSVSLKPISFKSAIHFNANATYLRYLVIPLIILVSVYISGNNELFSSSYERVLNHRLAYAPPAPFAFSLEKEHFEVHENKSITVEILVRGEILPENVEVHFLDQNYFVKSKGNGRFEYTFENVKESFIFSFSANDVVSSEYTLNMTPTPMITGFEMFLDYPYYTNKKDELVKNTGNAIVPEGTTIKWLLQGKNTDIMTFSKDSVVQFTSMNGSDFEHKERVFGSFDYSIASSNSYLKNFEALNYNINVVKDAFPKIEVRSNIDSIARGAANFYGQVSDDYGVKRLQMVFYNKEDSSRLQTVLIGINSSSFESFYYVFPEGVMLEEGIAYEMYFEVFDNDGVHGSKSSKSNTFSYYNKTEIELQDKLLEEQQETLQKLQESIDDNKTNRKDLEDMQESLQKKSEMNWNEQKQLDNFIQRQEQYEEMMKKQTDVLQRNLEDQPNEENKALDERKKDIQQRIEEMRELNKQNDLLEELRKLSEKLDKEELTKKLKELSEKNRQNDRSLERLLELTKRFYVEQKSNQIKEKLEDLSKEQDALSENEKNSAEEQDKLNKKFDEIRDELKQLDKDNKELKKPMDLPKSEDDEEEIEEEMNDAKDELQNSEKSPDESKMKEKSAAKGKQKSAAKKMKKMSDKMQSAMQSMSGEAMDEDIEMLRAILENLVEFSFQQEDLMNDFSAITNAHPSYSNNLKKQQVLREYFEHIDDSLYTLSLRQPKIGSEIFKDLSNVHYHLEEALSHFAENEVNVGSADQQFVMTSTNNIAALLSDILNGMQNASAAMGKGKGGGENSFSLPDIIKKQEDAIGKMEEGVKSGSKKDGEKGEENGSEGEGEPNGNEKGTSKGEEMNGELFELYKEQSELRRLLEEGLSDKMGKEGLKLGENALKQMETLERELLEKGFTNEVLQRMTRMKNELLKLEEAAYERGLDNKRESSVGRKKFDRRAIRDLDNEKLWFNENEILNRQSLPLRSGYKERVQHYFKVNDSIQ